ncbi:hypothetical protein M407DRAFT_217584 [Tulasnella calospora MUT 4182]|uniref:Ribosome assembly protein 3 n=1 Tax=Tulasnella calospora MUT 4182 TaxID=1051891 RepID=A0A0C3LKC4_9AGAM|nr:hypothetical protein M407DRAFT_217584 [Tulasnella calospora MUT 4182]
MVSADNLFGTPLEKIAPKAKRNKTSSTSIPVKSPAEVSEGDSTPGQAAVLSGERRERLEDGKNLVDEASKLSDEEIFGTDDGSSEEGSELESEGSQAREWGGFAQKEGESGSRPEETWSEGRKERALEEDGEDSASGSYKNLSLSQTQLVLSAAISVLGSALGKVQELSVSPESTRAAVQARSEWMGPKHPRYDILERKYNEGGLETDEIGKLVEMFKADMLLAEKIRRGVNDEVEVAASVFSIVTGLLGE